ncbi:hypothetical protein M0805_002046 [Coniferiporia weirii]|nr:hypothetical protein M0805_002046 [Coniferiporia weirii]
MSAFDSFGPVDDLVQVVYQGSQRFVLLSRVDFEAREPCWTVHLGLTDVGRWWRGRWVEKDVYGFVGANVSAALLDNLADKIARTLVAGELFIGGWTSRTETVELKIVFGPAGKFPLSIPLTELSASDAVVFTTNELFSLSLNAQQRKCRLNPPAFLPPPPSYTGVPQASGSSVVPPPSSTRKSRKASPPSSPPPAKPAASATKSKVDDSGKRRTSPTERTPTPAKERERSSTSAGPGPPATKTKVGPVRKKARVVQSMDFASDDE